MNLRRIGGRSRGGAARGLRAALCLGTALAAAPALAQGPLAGSAVRFGVTPPLRAMAPPGGGGELFSAGAARAIPLHRLHRAATGAVARAAAAASLPPPAGLAMPAATVSFAGLGGTESGGYVPPDPTGDVGPGHYVQIVNARFRVYDRAGAPQTAILKLSSLFASMGGPAAMYDDGDPIALYDPLADRWLLSQFVVSPWSASGGTVPCHQAIAVSVTPDPAGSYYVYDFVMPNLRMNDYPKLGVWPSAYFMTDNQFDPADNSYGAGVLAFDRAKMLAGDPTAGFVFFDVYAIDPTVSGLLPADVDGPPPPAGSPGYLACLTATAFGDAQDGLRIFAFQPDFATPANSVFTQQSWLATAAFDPNPADVPQPGTTSLLDTLSDRLMQRLQYRNFRDHASLVVNHTVNVAASRAGVRYYELRGTPPGAAFSIHDQGTFSPDATHRWMGSAAMDHLGNLAVGFSASSASLYPSIRYAGRLAADPAGTLAQGENTLVAGGGAQTSTLGRWGDYTMLAVDPLDDRTFWYVDEYYAATSDRNWATRIGAFAFSNSVPAPYGTLSGRVTDAASGLPLSNAVVRTADGYVRTTDAAGAYTMNVATGVYAMEVSAAGCAPSGTVAAVSDTALVTRDFALTRLGTFAFAAADYFVNETGPAAVVAVRRTGYAGAPAAVDYATADGTALAGVHYSNAAGSLTFPAGATLRSFEVPVIDNLQTQGVLWARLRLTQASAGAVLGVATQATLYIADHEDTTPPRLVAVLAQDTNVVKLVFDERMDPAGAEAAANYAIAPGVAVRAAVLDTDLRTLRLNVSALSNGTYALTAQQARDLSGNALAPTATNFTYPEGALLAWLKLDETNGTAAADSSGRGHPGLWHGTFGWTNGRAGNAALFNESNNYVTVANFAYGPQLTASFWFRPADNAGGYFQYVFSHGFPQEFNNLNVYIGENSSSYPGILRTSFNDSNDDTNSATLLSLDATLPALPDGAWHLYTLTVAAGEGARVYLDGRFQVANTNLGGAAFSPATAIHLACRSDLDANRMYGGGLDDVRLCNRALNSNEVAALFDLGPSAAIQSPRAGAEFIQRQAVPFRGTGSDPDGTVRKLQWDSNLDGTFGTGGEVDTNGLSAGAQTVTLSAYDDFAVRGATSVVFTVLADADANGLPDGWETLHWPSGGSGGATNDFDGDRTSNFAEWLAGTVPTDPGSVFQIVTQNIDAVVGAELLGWSSASGRVYDVQFATNLQSGSWFQPATGLPAAPPLNVYTGAAPAAPVFFRINVRKP